MRLQPLRLRALPLTALLLVCLACAACIRRTTVIAGPITQEETQGNAVRLAEYERFFAAARPGAVIPGLKQGFVPQGIAYLPERDWFLLSGYRDGGTSLLIIVNGATERLVKALEFTMQDGKPYQGHAGGVAVSDRYVWIASGDQVHYVALDAVVQAANGAVVPFAGHLPVDSRASFVTVAGNTLWVGEFAYGTSYPTRAHHHLQAPSSAPHKGWIAGYELDPSTGLIRSGQARLPDGAYVPDYVLSIPDKIQGALFIEDFVLLTESYGRNQPSRLLIYRNPLGGAPHATVQVSGASVPVWFLDAGNLLDTWILPPMAQSVAVRQDEAHVNFESGAVKYLDGSYALSRLQVVDVATLIGHLR